jgi:hypothetical protein
MSKKILILTLFLATLTLSIDSYACDGDKNSDWDKDGSDQSIEN